MNIKRSFFFVATLFLTAFLSHAQQMGLYPLTQYSVGTKGNMQLRTTTLLQQDTLKIPYIEDFSGPGLPIDSISIDTFSKTPTVLVYRITHIKMHGLKSGANIRVFNATGGPDASPLLNGSKYAKEIDKYTFQLFNDASLTTPATVDLSLGKMTYCNWLRIGAEGYSPVPDTLGFIDNLGGVFINNDMAVNPISFGVATFDGVDYRGIPYSTTTTKGYADNLTSLPFNLSQYNPKDSIYMSFYWQSKSLGDSPLSSEFLTLEFKDTSKTATWIQVWKQFGSSVTQDTFKIVLIPIIDSAYLHKSFQYRFRSYGVLNGRFNVWNLDYIYIDTNRSILNSAALKDISIISTSKSVLKNYTAVPYKHIRNLPLPTIKSETAQGFMEIRDNTYPSITSSIDYFHLTRDNRGNIVRPQRNSRVPGSYRYTEYYNDTIPGGLMDSAYVLKEEFYYPTVDTVGPIDLSFNNFRAIETYFYDYYSYDDGTPEVAFLSANPGGVKIASGYKILKGDQLTHVDYCFIRHNGPNLTNSALTLNVWEHDAATSKPKTTALLSQQIAIRYSSYINGFVRYELTTPLTLDSGAIYYFGYTQRFTNPLFLGYDRNNDHLNKLFFSNDGNTWEPLSIYATASGSLMLHPVFSDNEAITSVHDERMQQNQFTFYPNPAKSELHFTGQPEYIAVYDVSGLLLLEKKVEEEEILSTETLSNGLYLVILSKGDYKEVKRLIIQK